MHWGRVFNTELGWFGLIRDQDQRLLRLRIGFATESQLTKELDGEFCFQIDPQSEFDTQLEKRLRNYAAGGEADFRDVVIWDEWMTDFQRAVVQNCREIPFGETRSYGELAAASGSPGASRAVGSVMSGNRFPVIVPCHRVLAAGKKIGGFSAPTGVSLKRKILMLESKSRQTVLRFAKE